MSRRATALALGAAAAAAAAGLLVSPTSAAAAPGYGPHWPSTWSTWPRGTPSQAFPDGPILGNGYIAASIGGSDGVMTIYLLTNGFWGVGNGTNSTFPPHDTAEVEEDGGVSSPPSLGFPGCPADNCTIPVGLVIGGLSIASPDLAGTWTSTLYLENATAFVWLGSNASDASVEVVVWVSATTRTFSVSVRNTGASPLSTLNVTAWGNANILNVPVQTGCADAAAGKVLPSCPSSPLPPSTPPLGLYARKQANKPGSYEFPMDGVIALRPLLAAGAALGNGQNATLTSVSDVSFLTPQSDWSTGKTVLTQTMGTSQLMTLPAGAVLLLAGTAAASRDPSVYPADPADAASARLLAVDDSLAGYQALYGAHVAWWTNFWGASSFALDPSMAMTEAWTYSQLYAMGSASRSGELTADLWIWRTTDYPLWRSNPTTDYNQEALYSWPQSFNHVELLDPYYGFIEQQMASGGPSLESAALGCPGGLHFSVDLIPFGLKLGVYGVPQDWGIRTNAAYSAMTHVYQFYSTPTNTTWIETVAWPFLSGVASYWTCALVKTPVASAPDGYEWWDVNDCTGDEGCSLPAAQRTNPMWGRVYIGRLFQALLDMAAATGKATPPQWADIVAHLPPIPVTLHANGKTGAQVPVLAWYGQSDFVNFGGQANNLHAVWPGELVSMGHPNQTLVQAAHNALDVQAWSQSNSFSWVYSAAARTGYNITATLAKWTAAIGGNPRPNRLMAYGGLCSDSLGAAQFLADLLVQGQEGFLRVFPAWPGDKDASFTNFRMRGAVLVGALYKGQPGQGAVPGSQTGGTVEVEVLSEVGGNVTLLSPWPAQPPGDIVVCDLGGGGAGVGETTEAAAHLRPAREAHEKLAALQKGDDGGRAGRLAACSSPVAGVSWSTVAGLYGGPALTWTAAAGSSYVVYSTAQQ